MRAEADLADLQNISGCSVESAVCYLTRWNAVIGGNIALWRVIGVVWRDVRDTDEHYVCSIALQNEP